MVTLCLVAVMVVIQERILVSAVYGKGNRRNSEAWEAGLESVPSGEWACVSPCLTIQTFQVSSKLEPKYGEETQVVGQTYCRFHGSLSAHSDVGEAAALKVFMSKPVGFGGAISS